MNSASNLHRDNVVKDAASGDLYIPSSRRPDGTWRKPIKVKEGYIPQDEMPVYESRGSQLARQQQSQAKQSQGKQLPPGAVFVEETNSAKAKKKEKKPDEKPPVNVLSKMMAEIKVTSKISGEDFEADQKNKQIRKLKKTLREIEQLEEKVKSGELANPEKEQLDKMKKKESILKELEELNADTN